MSATHSDLPKTTDGRAAVQPGTTRLSYPGALGLPPVPVAFDVPSGWEALVLSEAQTLISEADGDASIVMVRERLDALATLEGVAQRLLDDASADAVEFALVDERLAVLGGLAAIRRTTMVRHDGREGRRSQLTLFTLVEVGGGVWHDLVAIVVTGALERHDELSTIVDGIEAGISFDG